MNEELNKKLAEWAGFKYHPIPNMPTMAVWIRPDSTDVLRLPNFTQSLDACFRWLVPKLRDAYSLFLEYDAIRDDFACYLGEVDDEGEAIIGETEYGLIPMLLPISANAETSALALCLAIEKLIDAEKV